MSLFSAKKLDRFIDEYKSKTGKRLTIREIAKETKISPAYLTLLKNGQRQNPSMDVVVKLSQFFQVAPEDLLEGTELQMTESKQAEKPVLSQTDRTLHLCQQLIETNSATQALDLLAMLEGTPEAKQKGYQIEFQLTKAKAMLSLWKLDEAMNIVDECFTLDVTTHERAKIFHMRARILFTRERYKASLCDLVEARKLAESSCDLDLLYQIEYMLGITYKETHEYGSSIYHFETAQRLFPENRPLLQKGHLLMGLGNTYLRLMSVDAAMHAYKEAETIYLEANDPKFIADIQHNIARVKLIEKQYEEAITIFQGSLKIHQTIGDHLGIAADLFEIAHCLKEMEQWEKVREFAFRSSVTYENGNMEGVAAQAKLLMVEAMLRLHDLNSAGRILDEIIKVFEARDWHLYLAHASHLKATLFQGEGKETEALQLSMKALDLYAKYSQETNVTK